ncbi:hypothetical protein FB566_2934 [Stackebrandtia endophytica]|uniref:Uncharacterized protein n=1 Tax=Stackebrandtia endophytica TaxID=1496996 RepID=A0A543AXS6_9ACTN|nr:hypothetical protein [Stackebrandtia endophytica]TQL77375.1 hypothetical protein FB566_2934 [Stackebrandtia endophytica]
MSRTRTQRKQPPIVLTAKIIATIRCALSLLVSGGMVLATGGYRSGVETAFGGLSLALAVLYGAFVVGLWLNANWGRLGALTVESLNLAVLVFFFFYLDGPGQLALSGLFTIIVITFLASADTKKWYEGRLLTSKRR